MVSASIEEYLETVYRLVEKGEKVTTTSIAKSLNVSPPSVTEMVGRLEKEGYLRHEPYGEISLTRKGRSVGEKIIKRHRILESFLEALGLAKSRLHVEACRLEHAVSPEVERVIDENLGFPGESPSGGRIPRGGVKSIAELRRGDKGVVVCVRGGRGVAQRLSDMGLTPGSEVKVVRSLPSGPLEVSLRGSKLALGRGVAAKVFVDVEVGE